MKINGHIVFHVRTFLQTEVSVPIRLSQIRHFAHRFSPILIHLNYLNICGIMITVPKMSLQLARLISQYKGQYDSFPEWLSIYC